ncbi:MCE family protein [Nocardioides sp. BP30]|uniref:MCE family protein n=1 Tax=Nocardioides sp. BP30 TaxID=3036374 RepID=UPI002468AF7C|nr:MCE family protein [Nocardioides sp. BP30]WGL53045.1 MCE family protein [Nocardioides sp. BP30]
MKRRRLLVSVVGTVAATLALSGCSFGGWIYNANLPGGAKLGSHPLTLTADFADVLDLVPQSSVKVNNVAVGRVSHIALEPDGHSAKVTLQVNRDATLPVGTTARIEQTSLLGEKYVALVPPGSAGSGDGTTSAAAVQAGPQLRDGARLPLASTSESVEVEQVLGALSMVLNGGGIGQFQEISRELQKIGDGRTDEIRDFLGQINRFVSTLDQRKGAITAALDGLDHLSTALQHDDDQIANALDNLSPGMKVLSDQRPQLVAMLQSLDKLSDVTVSTLDRSQQDIVADFKTLDPILTKLARAGSDLPNSLQILLTYPFPDSVLGAIKGDYLNVFMTTNFRTVPSGCAEEGCAWPAVGRTSVGASKRTGGIPPASPTATEAPPTLLPATDSPIAGASSDTVPGPSILSQTPSASADGSPAGSGSSSSSGSGAAAGTSSPVGSLAGTASSDSEGR